MHYLSSSLPAPGRLFLPGCAIAAGLLAVSSPIIAAPQLKSRPALVAGAPMKLRVGKTATFPLPNMTTFTLESGAQFVFCEVKNGTLTVKALEAGEVKLRLNAPGKAKQLIRLNLVETPSGSIEQRILSQVVERAPEEGQTPLREETVTTASPTSEQAPNSNLGAETTGGPTTGVVANSGDATTVAPSVGTGADVSGATANASGATSTTDALSPEATTATTETAPSPLSSDFSGTVPIPAPPAPLPALTLPAANDNAVQAPSTASNPVRVAPVNNRPATRPAPRAPQISPVLPAPARGRRANVSYRTTPRLPQGVTPNSGRQAINVTQGLARLLSFPSNILAVFFSDPNVMDARAINARTIAVTGVGSGPSTLAVFTSRYPGDAVGRANIYRIQTTPRGGQSTLPQSRDPRVVGDAITAALGDPRVRSTIISLPDGSLAARLSGTVRNESEVQAAVTTASFYVPRVVSSLYADANAPTIDAVLAGPMTTAEGGLQDNLRRITGNQSIELVSLPTGLAFKAEVNSPEEAEALLRVLPSLNQQVIPFIVVRGQQDTPYYNATVPLLNGEDRQLTQKLQDVTGVRTVYAVRASSNGLACYGTVRTRSEYDTVRRFMHIMAQNASPPAIQGTSQGGSNLRPAGEPVLSAYDPAGGYSRALGLQMFVRITDPRESVIRKVTVETSIVEISRSALKNLGVEVGSVALLGQTVGATTVTPGATRVVGGNTVTDPPTIVPGQVQRTIDPTFLPGTAVAGNGIVGLEGFQNLNPFRVRLNALFTNGDARLLARPNVTAVEGASAQITIGGERPVPKAVATQGAVGTQVEFRRFGVIITMRPTVSGDNTILLQIRADITQPDRTFEINLGGALIPGETVRSVDTTINVRPGDTVIMGGLMTNDKRQSTSKVPILGDLPIIGSLFRSRRFENNETELAIFMTPRIDASAAGMEEIENLNRVPSYPALPSRQESNSVLFQQTTRSAG
jgi:Flp pilus assembly secretin CpaC